VTQKLISSTESELQQSYAKQRRSKSAALLHKELNCKSKRAVRDYLFRVNEATAVLYARHVLASLLAEWPRNVPVSEDILELSGPAHMTYILDMFMQLEEKHQWEKVAKQTKLCSQPFCPFSLSLWPLECLNRLWLCSSLTGMNATKVRHC
jgi:hypothetical protein